MRERKKPSQSWIEKSKYEIENEEELLAKRIELLNDIRIKKLLYQDSEAFKVGYEAGFAKACEMLHDFAEMVGKMREAQKIYSDMFPTGYGCYAPTELEAEVDTWIKENYPHLMED